MGFEPFRKITSRTIVLPQENIDTDQIIPARFLTATSREGFGKSAFYDWRYDADGRLRNTSPLDGFEPAEFQILVAGSNFGCGSSREHAPWALSDFGFRAVVSSDIADIFKNNSLKNGLLPVEVDAGFHKELLDNPGARVCIDLEAQFIIFDDGDRSSSFTVEPFARRCLVDGVDQLGFLRNQEAAIITYEQAQS